MVSKGEVLVAQGRCGPGHLLYRAAAIGPVGMAVQVALEPAEDAAAPVRAIQPRHALLGRGGTQAPTRPGTPR